MEYALMVLAGCSGFTVAGVCYSCNMRGINFYGSLESFKKSIGMPTGRDTAEEVVYPIGFTPGASGMGPSNRSQKADAGRKTKKALDIAMHDLTQYHQTNRERIPGTAFAPSVDKRMKVLQDLYNNPEMRTIFTDPSSIKIKKVKKKK
jgi:hypothetical protein